MADNTTNDPIVILDKETLFSILAAGVRIDANLCEIYEGVNERDNLQDSENLIWGIMKMFSHILEDRDVEREFIDFALEHFGMEVPKWEMPRRKENVIPLFPTHGDTEE